MNRLLGRVAFWIAGMLLVVMFGLMFVIKTTAVREITYVGWVVWAIGIVLIPMPFIYFHRRGGIAKGKSCTHTTLLVDSGVYAVVRHPQYLGWLLMYPSLMLFIQHWLWLLLGAVGIACVIIFTTEEDQRLVEKFGEDYERYMQRVPQLNILVGIVRLARLRKVA